MKTNELPEERKGEVTESIFDGIEHIIPLADVQHIERYWSIKDKHDKINCSGIIIITKHTTWNFEHDRWENGIYLGKKEAENFLKVWSYYRYELEKQTLKQESWKNNNYPKASSSQKDGR